MRNPRLHKILRDLWLNLPRTILVVLAIAIGIFGVGFVTDAYSILTREIRVNYQSTNPPSATLWMDKIDGSTLDKARAFPGIADVEPARYPVRSRVEVGPNQWKILLLFVVDDFDSMRINKFFPSEGSWPPTDQQILLERSSMPVLQAEIGKSITMRLVNAEIHEIAVAGTVFDPSPDPAWVNDTANGYITSQTLKWLGGTAPEQGLRIVVSDNKRDRAHIREVATKLSASLKQNGYTVKRIEVPIPGKYQQTDKINSILFILIIFGLLCLMLSSFITALLITSLLSQQIRQIGVMKTLGADTHQIMGMYTGMVFIMSGIALLIGISLGVIVGKSFAISTLDMLNFNVTNESVSVWAFLLQIALGILVPVLTTLYPTIRGSRITVREAIRDYGLNEKNFGTGRLDQILEKLRGLPRPIMFSLRNTFRRRGRLLLSLIMLSIGGASFIASLGASASWNQTIDQSFASINYDIDIRFAKQYPADTIEDKIRTIKGVTKVEALGYAMSTAFPKYSDGTYGPAYAVFAPKNDTIMIHPPVVEGRWLSKNDTNAIVLDTEFVDNAKKLGTPINVGDDLTLSLSGKDSIWHVIGIMDKIGVQSAAYTNYDYFAETTEQKGNAMCARVLVEGHDKTLQKVVTQEIEKKLEQDNINLFVIQPLTVSRQIMVNHVVLILSLLMVMSVMVAVIGALGLASAMSINVMERTREIGIMRSIGATSRNILQSIIIEGIVIGLLSWLLGGLLSIPLTDYIARNSGRFIFPRIMVIDYPIGAPFLWLAIVIIISVAASFYPARKATRLTIREVLTYE